MIQMKEASADAFNGLIEALAERVAERLSRAGNARNGNARPTRLFTLKEAARTCRCLSARSRICSSPVNSESSVEAVVG